jgi:hypothetical protein
MMSDPQAVFLSGLAMFTLNGVPRVVSVHPIGEYGSLGAEPCGVRHKGRIVSMNLCLSVLPRSVLCTFAIGLLFPLIAHGAQSKKGDPLTQLMDAALEERAKAVQTIRETPVLLKENGIRNQLIYLLEKENSLYRSAIETPGGKNNQYNIYYGRLVSLVVDLNDSRSLDALMDEPLYGGFIEPETILTRSSSISPIINLLTKGNSKQKQGAARVLNSLLSNYPERVTEDEKSRIKDLLLNSLAGSESQEVKVMVIYTLRHFPEEGVIRALEKYQNDTAFIADPRGEKHYYLKNAANEVLQELQQKTK